MKLILSLLICLPLMATTPASSPKITTLLLNEISSIEVVYYKKYDGFLRPFFYGENSPEFELAIQWLKKDTTEWNKTDKEIVQIMNDTRASINFYDANNIEILTLWLSLEKAVLIESNGQKNVKPINKSINSNELDFIF